MFGRIAEQLVIDREQQSRQFLFATGFCGLRRIQRL